MSVIYVSTSSIVRRTDVSGNLYEETVISTPPNNIVFFDTGSGIGALAGKILGVTSSFALTASVSVGGGSGLTPGGSYDIRTTWASSSLSSSCMSGIIDFSFPFSIASNVITIGSYGSVYIPPGTYVGTIDVEVEAFDNNPEAIWALTFYATGSSTTSTKLQVSYLGIIPAASGYFLSTMVFFSTIGGNLIYETTTFEAASQNYDGTVYIRLGKVF